MTPFQSHQPALRIGSDSWPNHYRNGMALSIPFRESPQADVGATILRMDANQNRTAHMRRLVAEAGGPAKWAARYGGTRWTAVRASQWIAPDKPKSIGSNLARALEVTHGLSRGTLDMPPEGAAQSESQSVKLNWEKLHAARKFVDRLAESHQKQFAPEAESLAIAAAYEYLILTANPDPVHMAVAFGKLLEVEDERYGEAARTGTDDRRGARKRARAPKTAGGG